MTTTGFVYDERFLLHETGDGALVMEPDRLLEPDEHVESATRIRRTVHLLERSGLVDELRGLPFEAATMEEVTVYHPPEYVRAIADFAQQGGGYVAPSTSMGTTSHDIALLAAGGGLAAVKAVLQGDVTNAYAMLRPPGHHALADEAMGFCLFNNIAIAAKLARARWGVERVAIVDWDVHHGNGTQAAFYDDPSVLFVSLHQDNLFPVQSGLREDAGERDGRGYTVNVPLPAGTGDAGYQYAFERVLVPILEQFVPQLILVSAGQDPCKYDPLGRMCVSAAGFRAMATTVRELADRLCGGRLALLQEGGYSHVYIPFATLAIVEAVSGFSTGVSDPFRPAHDTLKDWQRQTVEAVVATQRQFWKMD